MTDHLPPDHRFSRVKRIANLVLADAEQAISCHACFVAANDELRALSPDGPVVLAGAATFSIAHYAQLAYSSLLLARMFDPGKPRSTLDGTDIASIPILMRYLGDDEVRDHLVEEARTWSPAWMGLEREHADTAAGAARDVQAVWNAFQTTADGARVLADLKRFRNEILAHTLDLNVKCTPPIVNDAYQLFDVLLALVRPVSVIFRGQDWDAATRHRMAVNQGRAFWRQVLKASYDSVHNR